MKTVIIRAAALTIVLSLSLVQLDGGWLWSPASASGSGSANQPGVHILDSDEMGITLELYTPDFQVKPRVTGEIACDQLGVTDYATNDRAGWPALPVRGAMLGIPPDANLTLTVLSTDAEMLPDRYALCPVPTPIVETELSGEIRFGGYQLVRDTQAYAANGLSPTSSAELVETGFIRSQWVAQVRFHPFQYNPTSGEVRYLQRIQVRLDFNRDFSLDGAAFGAMDEGAFEEMLSNALLNYDAARQWRTRPERTASDSDVPQYFQYKVLVDTDGIYEITYTDLQAAGIDPSAIDLHTLHLSNQGQEVAIYVAGEQDGSFDPGDYVLFYGQKVNSKYTDVNVYWLTWGLFDGQRMAEIDASPSGWAPTPSHFQTTQHIEEDHVYDSRYPSGPDDDRWYWDSFRVTSPTTHTYTTTLFHIATTPFSATVRGIFHGRLVYPPTISNHHARVYLNGYPIDDATWPAKSAYSFEEPIPSSYLTEGVNTIVFEIPLDLGGLADFINTNQFEIVYHSTYTADNDLLFFDGEAAGTWEYHINGFYTDTIEVFDITTPRTPMRILNTATALTDTVYTISFEHTITNEHHYLALALTQRMHPLGIEEYIPSTLHSIANGADYIIITHADFYASVLPLADYRASQGLRTVIVDVQDVYDEFYFGIFDPEAIRDFLAYAYANWMPPAPAYVLLVGDGNYDFKNNEGTNEPSYIPPYLADVDPEIREAPTDNRYVCVSGSDILPDMHIGRLPAKTSAEVDTMVNKIINYEQNPPTGDWNQKLLFVADDGDASGDFAAVSNSLISDTLPSPYQYERVYLGVTHPWENPSIAARDAILDAINEGRLLVNYIGHGGHYLWAFEHLLDVNYVATLTNTEHLPLMVPMTCSEGYFIHPPSETGDDESSVGESIVRASGGGAIASWSPTGLGTVAGHDFLNRGLFEAIFSNDIVQLGPATTQGKLYLYSHTGGHRDLIDTYVLFGDPALALAVPQADVGVTKTVDPPDPTKPGDTITYTLTYSNTGPTTAHHVVITDTLPTVLLSPTVTHTGATITQRPGSRFVWDAVDLAASEGGSITITATISPQFLTGTFSNTVTIVTSAVESDMGNNSAIATITVTPPYTYYFPIILQNNSYDILSKNHLTKGTE